jgi:threonine/homoserine/homoserine lactone efflux protein
MFVHYDFERAPSAPGFRLESGCDVLVSVAGLPVIPCGPMMPINMHGLAAFCVVYLIAVATPGPGIAATVARALARGTQGLPAFIAGFVVGDLTWFTFAATGMAALAHAAHGVFMAVKYLGALYLLYLAFRMWTTPARVLPTETEVLGREGVLRVFAGSLALTLGNPKAMVFYLALLPTVIDLQAMTMMAFAQIALVIFVILSGVLTTYAIAAARARRIFRNERALKWLNRTSGTVMAGAAVGVAAQ